MKALFRPAVACAVASIAAWLPCSAAAQQDFSAVSIGTVPVAPGVYMLTGSGGNIGLFTGPEGALLVDNQYAPLSEKILAAVREVTDRPLRFVLNTHWHGDHTGGNANLAATGIPVIAHDNVRIRMSRQQTLPLFRHNAPPSPVPALPVVTFAQDLTFHLNGETIRVIHVPNAHTDGDAIVHFRNANVFHMGDTFWNGAYPRIDAGIDGSGGSVQGVIAAMETVLALANDQTRFIPGHGPLPAAGAATLRTYLEVLTTSRDAVQRLIDQGLTEDQVVAARPTQSFDAQWGTGYIQPEVFARILYRSLKP